MKPQDRRLRLVLTTAVAAAGMLLLWYWKGGGGYTPPVGQTKRVEIRLPILASSALQSLDPIKSVELVQYNLCLQIFECLVAVGSKGEIQPALAAKWESSPDFKVWTFHLRKARFADDPCFPDGKGRPVTVEDVLFSWKRGLNPKAGSLNSWALSACVLGADAFSKGETNEVAGLEKLSDQEFRVTLVEPDQDFLTRLTVLSTAIVPREAVERYGKQFDAHPVGSGPFKLAEWVQGEFVLLERNPAYGVGEGWQPSPAKIERVRFKFFRSEAQVALAFQDGLLDVRDVSGADLARLENLSSLEALKAGHPEAEVLRPGAVCRLYLLAPMLGPEYAFGSSAELRRSLAATFDHAQLKASAVGPLGEMTKSLMLPKGILVDGLETSPDSRDRKAPALPQQPLAGRTVKVAYVSSRINDVAISLLRRWIEQHGGSVRLFPSVSYAALFASVGQIKPDLTLIYWSPYFPNVANYLTALLSSSRPVPNFTGFTNDDLDKAAQQLKTAQGERALKVRQAIKTILDREMPWIPLYYDTPLILQKPHVRNYGISPLSVMLLKDVELEGVEMGGKGGR